MVGKSRAVNSTVRAIKRPAPATDAAHLDQDAISGQEVSQVPT